MMPKLQNEKGAKPMSETPLLEEKPRGILCILDADYVPPVETGPERQIRLMVERINENLKVKLHGPEGK